MNNNISIIGCGWLGLPLAETLVKANYNVKGATTTYNKLKLLKQKGIQPHHIHLSETGIKGNINNFYEGTEIVIINIPPGLRKQPNKNHVKEMQFLIKAIKTSIIKHIIYISSTSVFKNTYPFSTIINSTKPNNTSTTAQQLIKIEQLISELKDIKSTIVRFSGLFDETRHPGKFLSGKENIKNPLAPINLIHKNDAINSILKIIELNSWNNTFNAAYPFHSSKKDYYTSYCKTHNLALPKFESLNKNFGKIIDSSYLCKTLNYAFKHKP